jgi:ABC-2 type transporter
MSTIAVSVPVPDARDRRIPLGVVRDTLEITRRNLIGYLRVPQLLVFSTIQPVIFVLMFRYVFGGAITVPGDVPYVDFLKPGIFVQTVVFGAIATAIGLATDLKGGLMERFRALPMARSAVLTGRTAADLSRNVFVVILMMAVGFLVGWRLHTNFWGLLGAGLLVLLFGYAMSWIFAAVGLAVGKSRIGPGGSIPGARAVGVRLVGVRARLVHARMVAGIREPPTGLSDRVGGASAHARRTDRGRGLESDRMVRGNPAGIRADRRVAVPSEGVSPRGAIRAFPTSGVEMGVAGRHVWASLSLACGLPEVARVCDAHRCPTTSPHWSSGSPGTTHHGGASGSRASCTSSATGSPPRPSGESSRKPGHRRRHGAVAT